MVALFRCTCLKEIEAGCTPNHNDNLSRSVLAKLQFQDNAANEAGNILYGGNLESCGVCSWSHNWYFPGK